jgi:hypothetical protein
MRNERIIAPLIAERDQLSRAIEALQGSAKMRGRPLKNSLIACTQDTIPKRMKAYCAPKRKKEIR